MSGSRFGDAQQCGAFARRTRVQKSPPVQGKRLLLSKFDSIRKFIYRID